MAKGKIRGEQIKDESIDSIDIASGSIKAGELGAQAISGQTLITAIDAADDRLLVWDDTDSALKQVAPEKLFEESGIQVGIGTASPANTLHVNNSTGAEIWASRDDSTIAADDQLGVISFAGTEDGSSFAEGAHIIGAASEAWNVGSAEGACLQFCTKESGTTGDPAERMIIDHTGSVGIGTSNPTEELDVEGDIKAHGNLYVADSAGMYTDKIRRYSDSDNTTKILLNDELIKLYAGHSSENICAIGQNSGADTNFYVSGSIGSRHTSTRGTAVFDGDLVLSGGLEVDGSTLVIDEAKSLVGIGTDSPRVKLDVMHDPTSLSDDTGGGEVVTFGGEDGTDTLAAGKLMFLHSGGDWKYADADAAATSGGVLLAIALGGAVTDGLLIRGFFNAATIEGSFVKGAACYVSEAAGTIDFTAPSGVDDVVRVVGYGTDTANVIYFNPSSTWIELE